MDILTTENEEMKEVTSSDEEKESMILTQENFPKFLQEVGLETPIDYVFNNYAMIQSRKRIENGPHDQLIFLFHLVTDGMLKEEKTFPRCAFIEKAEKDDMPLNIFWTFSPSSRWETREIRSFEDFHYYFMTVMKPNFSYSAEQLYQILNEKRGESYFLNHGSRKNSEDGNFHILFVTPKCIVAFQVPQVDVEGIKKKELFHSKWISLDQPAFMQDCCEFETFEFPPIEYLDILEKQKENEKVVSYATEGLETYDLSEECENCSG